MNIRYTYTDGQVAELFAQDNDSDYFEIGGKVVRIEKVCQVELKRAEVIQLKDYRRNHGTR